MTLGRHGLNERAKSSRPSKVVSGMLGSDVEVIHQRTGTPPLMPA